MAGQNPYIDWGWFVGVGFLMLIAVGFVFFLGFAAQAGFDERQVWNDSCTDRGGIVVTQYRADDWCVKDGIIIDSGRGN